MAWNFRKRIKVAPGVKLNVSKKGVSTTVGPKGMTITTGKDGTYLNRSIPGTGLYSRQKISGPQIKNPQKINVSTSNTYNSQETTTKRQTSSNKASDDSMGCLSMGFLFIVGLCFVAIALYAAITQKWFGIRNTILAIGFLLLIPLYTWFLNNRKGKTKTMSTAKKIINSILATFGLVAIGFGLDSFSTKHDNKSILIIVIGVLLFVSWIILRHSGRNIQNAKSESSLNKSSGGIDIKEEKKDIVTAQDVADSTLSQTIEETNSVMSGQAEDKIYIPNLDSKFVSVAKYVVANNNCYVSTSTLQRKLGIGYKRAGDIMQQLEWAGIVSKVDEHYRHTVLCKTDQQLNSILRRIPGLESYNSFMDSVSNIDSIQQRINSIKEISDRLNAESLLSKNNSRLPESLYKDIVTTVTMLHLYLQVIGNNENVNNALDSVKGIDGNNTLNFTINSKLAIITLRDFLVCYKNLGYDVHEEKGENIAITLFVIKIISPDSELTLTQDMVVGSYRRVADNFITKFNQSFKCSVPEDKLFLSELFKARDVDKSTINRYLTLLYEVFSLLSKVDGRISVRESTFLSKILQDISDLSSDNNDESKHSIDEVNSTEGKAETQSLTHSKSNPTKADRELEELIGLESVKEEVRRMTNFVKVQQLRKEKGLTTSPISYHCVFTGNPGTGKTTVARILAEIYRDLGLLTKGHLIETDRSGLVAEYVGQTAVKTNKIIDSALGGVLFIDEAYSLVQGGNNDYGMEAISTLLKRMEDDRDKLVVILAGYGDEMKKFIDSNPGLQSRFNRYIHFPDYSAENLMDIFALNVKKYEYVLDDKSNELLKELFKDAVEHKDKNFGNGRFARNVLEKILENQATRLASQSDISEEELCMIVAEDVINFKVIP